MSNTKSKSISSPGKHSHSSSSVALTTNQTEQHNQSRHSINCLEYPSSLFSTINQFRLSDLFTDVTIYVDGVPFACHRLILAAASPYFRAMFSYNFRESTEGNVRIQDITPWTMKRILEFIYTGHTDITYDNLFEMFNASVMLSIKELTDLLIKFLYLQMNIYNCIQIEQLATLYSLENLRRTTLQFIVDHFMCLYEKHLFVHLNEHTLMEVLSDDNLDIPKEEYVFLTIVQWVNYRPVEREQYFQSLFKFIRLNSISDSDFVTNSMRNEKLVQKYTACLRTLKDFYSNNFIPDLLGPIRPSTQIRYHLIVIELPSSDDENDDEEQDQNEQVTNTNETDDSIVAFYQKFSSQLQIDDATATINVINQNHVESNNFDYSLNFNHHPTRSPSPDSRLSSSYCLLHAYDFFRQRWRFLGRLPELFSHVSCVSTNTTLYIFGGQLRSGELSDRIWLFSLSTLKWQMSSVRLPCSRGQHICVLFHNVVLLFFGITNTSSSSSSSSSSPSPSPSSSSNPCPSVDMFDLASETWTCLGESVPLYQCEPIVATGQWLLLSNKNDTQMLHTYKLRMQQHDGLTNGQIVKMNASSDELASFGSTTTKDKAQLSRSSSIDNTVVNDALLTSAGYYMLPRNNTIGRFSPVTHDDDLYLVYWQSKQIYRFNLVRNEILLKQSMPYSYMSHCQCVLVDRRLIVSGVVSLSNLTDIEKESLSISKEKKSSKKDFHWIIQIYNIDNDQWSILQDQQIQRKHLLFVGPIRKSELSEPIEDPTKHETIIFSSYKQVINLVDDCKDTIWFVHIRPNEQLRQSLIYLSSDKWRTIERRLSLFNIQTGVLNCTNNEYSNFCRAVNIEQFVLLVPSINRRSIKIYSRSISSIKDYNYQYILKWLSKTLENHMNKDFDWYELPQEKRSTLEFQINSNLFLTNTPIYYFTLLYRYGSIVNFRLTKEENTIFQIKYSFQNSTTNTYIYSNANNSYHYHELYTYRALNIFLSCLTISIQTLIYFYFITLNIYFFYDIYLVESLLLVLKKILMINLLSIFLWLLCLTCLSTEIIDYILQMISFYVIKSSQYSTILMFIRNDLFFYSIISKWILYATMIILHIAMGLCFRWYLKERLGRTTYDISNDVMMIDQMQALCSKLWQLVLCLLFSQQRRNEHIDNSLLQYFSQDSLFLNQYVSLTINSNVNMSNHRIIDLRQLSVWRFSIRRRKSIHGANEYYSDIELEPSSRLNEQDYPLKKSSIHRRRTNIVSTSQQDHFYASDTDENNNSLNSNRNEMNISKIYQCSICLEKYFNSAYICTLPCFHHFHRKCLSDWFSNSEHNTCPLCRSSVLF
ncbi:unnamed protein product [Rotaria socialis]|uniref:Uncharacterized protein n=1 Tax=Rotaria socialis TaxID=392032 RepID=A0A820S487_9BILA|nr:unnamed protein product [Rotaria socialis]